MKWVLAAILLLLFYAMPAHAQVFAPDGTLCPIPVYGYGLVSRMVNCVQWTVLGSPDGSVPGAVNMFLLPFSAVLSKAVAAVCTLAVLFYGYKLIIIGGQTQRLTGDTVVFGLKLAAVTLFSYDFGGMFPWVLAITTDLMNAVTIYIPFISADPWCAYNVWQSMDCALDRLIGGILPGSTIITGSLGFMAGLLFGGSVGVSIALMGFWLVLFMVNAIFKAVFVYLSAIFGLMFMALISPITVPCMLFSVTRPYFEKWLRLLMGLMLQPVFLAAYVSMLLIAFEAVVFSGPNSLYAAIAGPNLVANPNFRLGYYMAYGSGAYGDMQVMPMAVAFSPGAQANWLQRSQESDTGLGGQQALAQVNPDQMNGQIGMFFDPSSPDAGLSLQVHAVSMQVLAYDRGMDFVPYVVNVALSLLQAAVLAYIFYTMQGVVPYLGTVIAGGVAGGMASLPDLSQGYDSMAGGIQERLAGRGNAAETARENVPGVGDR